MALGVADNPWSLLQWLLALPLDINQSDNSLDAVGFYLCSQGNYRLVERDFVIHIA
jgi:hypothetical protein